MGFKWPKQVNFWFFKANRWVLTFFLISRWAKGHWCKSSGQPPPTSRTGVRLRWMWSSCVQDISIPTPFSGTKHTPFLTISQVQSCRHALLPIPKKNELPPLLLSFMCTGYLHSYPFLRYKAYAIPNHFSGTKHTPFLTISQLQSIRHS